MFAVSVFSLDDSSNSGILAVTCIVSNFNIGRSFSSDSQFSVNIDGPFFKVEGGLQLSQNSVEFFGVLFSIDVDVVTQGVSGLVDACEFNEGSGFISVNGFQEEFE